MFTGDQKWCYPRVIPQELRSIETIRERSHSAPGIDGSREQRKKSFIESFGVAVISPFPAALCTKQEF